MDRHLPSATPQGYLRPRTRLPFTSTTVLLPTTAKGTLSWERRTFSCPRWIMFRSFLGLCYTWGQFSFIASLHLDTESNVNTCTIQTLNGECRSSLATIFGVTYLLICLYTHFETALKRAYSLTWKAQWTKPCLLSVSTN